MLAFRFGPNHGSSHVLCVKTYESASFASYVFEGLGVCTDLGLVVVEFFGRSDVTTHAKSSHLELGVSWSRLSAARLQG